MSIDSDDMRVLFAAATTGKAFEDTGMPESARAAFESAQAEVAWLRENNVLVATPNEWEGLPDEFIDNLYAPSTMEELIFQYGEDVPQEALERNGLAAAKSVGGFEVSKAVTEERFTLGPMYVPNRLDAHAEWTDGAELQKAVWDYVKSGDRRIRLQHDRDRVAGEWVEVMTWPYEVEVPMLRKDADPTPVAFPAGTVFLGVRWEPWAWEMVKANQIRGYSIGGRAERLYVDLEDPK